MAPMIPWARPSHMKGTRMNQLVAPTNFITETSRLRAKIANRIVFTISTDAETSNMSATPKNAHCRTWVTFSIV